MNLLATIPSPGSGAIHIGPLQLRAYGLMIALGVIAAVWLFGRRMEQKGIGTRDDASSVSVWAVAAGVLGARLYHVITSWDTSFSDNPLRIFEIWEGGLGIPGGLVAGILVGVWRVRARGLPVAASASAAAPAIPLAQAIGRWGNWWNQEIFGRPTKLPWALEVDDDVARRAGYPPGTTFHPTFLYESLGNVVICIGLLWMDRRFKLRPGRLLAVYLAGYALLRFGVESLRVDEANEILGLRVNTWVSGVVLVGAVGFLVVDHLRHRGDPDAPDAPDESTSGAAEATMADDEADTA
ncbi:MAG: prolipoprotein diacylglyceryl transferase [Acidimicrobiia bacterium]